VSILLDGGLKAPPKYLNQKTIIGGDEKEPLIALASIVAKVLRDRRMVRYAKIHPKYSFEVHKGYGTALHRRLIKKHGPSVLHRRSFIKNLK
jgi:ribonuclease HII